MRRDIVKIYKVRVNHQIYKGFWYKNHSGEEFDCILKCKYCASQLMPVFFVVNKAKGEYRVPVTYLTIRPEDCAVIHEQIILATHTFGEFATRTMADNEIRGNNLKQAS